MVCWFPAALIASGVRIGRIEASLSLAFGPASKQNIGLNVTIWFPLRSVF